MKLTLEPTDEIAPTLNHSVTLITATDDLPLSDVIDLMHYALLAWGYHPDNIDEYFNEGGN